MTDDTNQTALVHVGRAKKEERIGAEAPSSSPSVEAPAPVTEGPTPTVVVSPSLVVGPPKKKKKKKPLPPPTFLQRLKSMLSPAPVKQQPEQIGAKEPPKKGGGLQTLLFIYVAAKILEK